MIVIAMYVRIRLNPKIAPKSFDISTLREKIAAIVGIWPLLVVFGIIIGGIYSGFCTPTEAGAVGASVVLLYSIARGTGFRQIAKAFHEAAALTAQIFILVVSGQILSKVVSLSEITNSILAWMGASNFPDVGIITIFIVIYLVLGAILDPISMMVLTLPLSFPILINAGVDPIALGVVVVLLVEVAVITPPIGFNVYVVAAIAGADPEVAFRGSILFFFVLMLMIVIVLFFPGLATWLPNLAFG
jgi:TRAP-type C4-dicarboxylate transport system permease large subunit